jgi:hypothetical protein
VAPPSSWRRTRTRQRRRCTRRWSDSAVSRKAARRRRRSKRRRSSEREKSVKSVDAPCGGCFIFMAAANAVALALSAVAHMDGTEMRIKVGGTDGRESTRKQCLPRSVDGGVGAGCPSLLAYPARN